MKKVWTSAEFQGKVLDGDWKNLLTRTPSWPDLSL